MVTTPHTLIETQAQLPTTAHADGLPGAGFADPIPGPIPDALATGADRFEQAIALDSILLAYERRKAGAFVHRAPDAVRVLTPVAEMRALRLDRLPTGDQMERISELARRIGMLRQSQQDALQRALDADRAATPWRPARGTQCLGYELAGKVDVLLLGGSAGGGKTDLMLGIGAMQQRAIRVIRATSGEFAPMYTRLAEIAGSADGRNLGSQTFALPGPRFGHGGKGAVFEFNGLADPDSEKRLQGRPVSMFCLDDAGSGGVPLERVQFGARWLRSTEPGLHKLLCFTSNPPSSGDALWLRDQLFYPWLAPSYAGEPARSGEIRYFLIDGDNEREVPAGTPGAESRAVVLSHTRDNVRLARTGYIEQLARAPSALLRTRLLHGDDPASWSAGFDTDDASQVIPSAWVDAAMARWQPNPPQGLDAQGVDVARGGKDRTVIAARHGDWFSAPRILTGTETANGQQVAAAVLALRGSSKHAITFLDATGVGASPYDILRERVPAVAVIFGAAFPGRDASGSFEFTNTRSALWWRFREALDPSNPRRIALPPDRVLKAELCMPRYELRGGRLFVEGRDDIIKRLKRSPDVATAYILAAIPTNSTIAASANSVWRRAALRERERERALSEAKETT